MTKPAGDPLDVFAAARAGCREAWSATVSTAVNSRSVARLKYWCASASAGGVHGRSLMSKAALTVTR
jgi:hypothetical protein